jgi:CheY-like chemotaxis protein/anti-sigma regulatory factor (Ser/Thr protein kinase)
MVSTLLIAEDDSALRRLLTKSLEEDGYSIIEAPDGPEALEVIQRQPVDLLITDVVMPKMSGLELLEKARALSPGIRSIVMTGHGTAETVINAFRSHACDFLEKPFKIDDLRAAVHAAMDYPLDCGIEVLSSKPDWIEVLVPCSIGAIYPLQKLMSGIEGDLPQETRDAIGTAFREMLTNAIEHGGKSDPSKLVHVKYIRLKRAILYSIKDPGEGFDMTRTEHTALSNPQDQPLQHVKVRQERGLRPGGYGIVLASQLIDELIYNEKHNELIFVKYLDVEPPASST